MDELTFEEKFNETLGSPCLFQLLLKENYELAIDYFLDYYFSDKNIILDDAALYVRNIAPFIHGDSLRKRFWIRHTRSFPYPHIVVGVVRSLPEHHVDVNDIRIFAKHNRRHDYAINILSVLGEFPKLFGEYIRAQFSNITSKLTLSKKDLIHLLAIYKYDYVVTHAIISTFSCPVKWLIDNELINALLAYIEYKERITHGLQVWSTDRFIQSLPYNIRTSLGNDI